jgi:hypothetical protein
VSTHWRCAVCDTVNDGGDTCAACGARVTQTVVQPPPAEATPAPETTPTPDGGAGDDAATDIPVRELPRRSRLEPDRPDVDPDATYGGYERVDTRPRVRVYGCCLPIALGMLLAFVAAVTLLANLLLAAL